MKTNKKGFTLIELLAIIVILAIIALIAVPVVLNIVDKARAAANLRTIEAVASQVQVERYEYMLANNGYEPSSDQWQTFFTNALSDVTGNGAKVSGCTVSFEAGGKLTMTGCSLDGSTYTYNYATGASLSTSN